jgi:hypothetical protein
MPTVPPNAQNALTGIAGVHFIVSELSQRGLIALPTIRNTAGTDIVATDLSGTWHANIQVKTSKNRVTFWPIGKHYADWQGDKCWYAFVRYLKTEGRFEVFMEGAERVAKRVAKNVERDRKRGNAEWQPRWGLPKNETEAKRLADLWRDFGPGA